MSNILPDVWECPNTYGGCEDTLNPSWHTHCPICGAARGEPSPKTKVDRVPRERVSSSAPDLIDTDNINDATMSDSNVGDRKFTAGSSETIGSWSRLINTHQMPPDAAAAFESATENKNKQFDTRDRQVSDPTETAENAPLTPLGHRTTLYDEYEPVPREFFEPPLEAGWKRLRFQCSCGGYFYDDFLEQRTDGIAALIHEIRQSLPNTKITTSPVQEDFRDLLRTDRIAALLRVLRVLRQSLPNVKITAILHQTGLGIQRIIAGVPKWLHCVSSSLLAALSWNNGVRAGLGIQQIIASVSTWLHRVSTNLLAAFSRNNRSRAGLPQHNASSTTTPIAVGIARSLYPLHDPLLLMSCVHYTRNDIELLQEDVGAISNDRALFKFLRSKIWKRRGRFPCARLFRFVNGIFFSKFRVSINGSVEVRHHDPCCRSVPQQAGRCCECLPPIENIEPFPNAEYRCTLPCPPGTWPPVGPSMLYHMLKCPNEIAEASTWIYNLVPKRTTGELYAYLDQPIEGWGFYFQEGWHFNLIITISFALFIVGSLIFGVCWSVLKSDIQGAFGVSAYMVTTCGLFVAFVVSKMG